MGKFVSGKKSGEIIKSKRNWASLKNFSGAWWHGERNINNSLAFHTKESCGLADDVIIDVNRIITFLWYLLEENP